MADRMSERQLLALVEQEFSTAMGAVGGEIAQERADAWKYYLSKKLGNEIEGQSEVVTSDVADAVDGMMPSLLRIFTTADNLVDFDAVGSDDVPKAEQESDYVNHVFFKQNPAFEVMYTWFFDALVQKNGIVKAWWDDSEIVTRESYQGLTDAELAELMDDEELEPVERDEREPKPGEVPAAIRQVSEALEETGEIPEGVKVHDVTFERTSKKGRVRIANVPPEEYRISADARSIDPEEARMVGHEREVTRSELLEMGFSKSLVEDLPSHGDTLDSEEEIARRDKTDETDDAPHDRSQDKILVKEAYIRVDYDGDGRSELRQIFAGGGKVLSNEEVDRQPFHVISPQPLPHKHFGRALAEKVMDVQKVQTTLVRQILDNLYHTNNPSHAVWEQGMGDDTLDDLLTTRVGSVKRFRRPVSESYSQITVPFTAGQTFPMLEYWDKVKRDRTGVASDGEGLNPEQLKNIQTSVLTQANDLARMKIEAVARIFAETGVKSLFRHIHELLLKHQKKEEVVQLRNEWVQVNPQEWRTRQDMTVKIGLGIGTRDQNLLHLDAIWQKQAEIVQNGGGDVLVTGRNLFNTAAEIVKNANLKDPSMFFSDPGDQPLQQQSDEQTQLAQAQLQVQQRDMELRARDQEITRERNLMQHQRDIEKAQLQNQREVEKIQIQRESDQNDLMVKMEEIANRLTELDLEYRQTDVPGSRVSGGQTSQQPGNQGSNGGRSQT